MANVFTKEAPTMAPVPMLLSAMNTLTTLVKNSGDEVPVMGYMTCMRTYCVYLYIYHISIR